MSEIQLREVVDNDLTVFFQHLQDPDAVWMAAFTPKNPEDFLSYMAHWTRLRSNESIIIRTIEVDGAVAGHIASWPDEGARELTYWIGREHWGKGVATEALRHYIEEVSERPLRARAAKDNVGSLRVLKKCGFVEIGDDRGFANARDAEIAESICELA